MKRFLVIILLLSWYVTATSQSKSTNWWTVLSDSTPFVRALPSGTVVYLLDSNQFYRLTAKRNVGSFMAQAFASGEYVGVPNDFGNLTVDTLYISDSIYDLRTNSDYFYFNDTIFGIKDLPDSLLLYLQWSDTTTLIGTRYDVDTLSTSTYDSLHWIDYGAYLAPADATDDVVCLDSLRTEGFTYLKDNTTIDGRLILDDGTGCVFIGTYSGLNNSGTECFGSGYSVLKDNQGVGNTGSGSASLLNNTVGIRNSGFGSGALYSNLVGDYLTGVGNGAGRSTGALSANDSSTRCTYLGADTRSSTNRDTNATTIGYQAISNGSNTVTLGDDNVTAVYMSEDAGATVYATNYTVGSQQLTQGTINRYDVNNSFKITDTLHLADNMIYQTSVNKVACEGSWGITDSLVFFQGSSMFKTPSNTNSTTVAGSFVVTDTLHVGTQYAWASTVNNLSFENSVTATDTLFAPVVNATTNLVIVGQVVTQDHVNNALFSSSLTATDTLFAPVVDATTKVVVVAQTITQDHVNNALFNNSVTASDTVFAPVINPTTNLTIGSQVLTQKNTNGITWNNSVTATDTLFGSILQADNAVLLSVATAADEDTIIAKNANGTLYAIPYNIGLKADTTSLAWIKGGTNVFLRDMTDSVGVGVNTATAKFEVLGQTTLRTTTTDTTVWIRQGVADGRGLLVSRNNNDTETNPLVTFLSDHTATQQPTLSIDHDGTGGGGYALWIDSENADAEAALIYGGGVTIVQDKADVMGLTVFRILNEAGSDALVKFYNDHATNTQPVLMLGDDGSGVHITTRAVNEDLEIDPNGTGSMILRGTKTTSNVFEVINDNDGSVGDSSFVVTKLGGVTTTGLNTLDTTDARALLVTDTLSGLIIKASDGTYWRLQASVTGVLKLISYTP